MRALLLAAIAILGSACGGSDGVFIEVQRPPGMPGDRVQLLIADRGCQLDGVPCESMQPQDFNSPLEADVFFRDALDEYTAAFEGDTATFQLEAKDKRLPLVLAIASRPTDRGREITGIAIMRGTIDLARDPVRYEVLLESPEGSRAVVTWPHDAPALRCVGVRDADGTNLFVVPDDDPDCDDEILAMRGITECAPLAFLGFALDGDAQCLTDDALTGACVLGAAPTCDESGSQTSCVGGPICMPDSVCATCDPMDLSCAAAELGESPTRVVCTLPAAVDTNNNNLLVPCETAMPVLVEPFETFDCKAPPHFADPANPADPFSSGRSDLPLGASATLQVTRFEPTCKVELDWQGSLAAPGPLSFDTIVHAEVLQPSTQARRELLVPVTFKIEVGCGVVPPRCTIDAVAVSDSVFSCAQ